MICKRLKDFLALLLVGLATGQAMAQTTNLIKNPDFEMEGTRIPHWLFHNLYGERVSTEHHSGSHAASAYSTGGTISFDVGNGVGEAMNVVPGTKFVLSYWYKGAEAAGIRNLFPTLWWRDASGKATKQELRDKGVRIGTEWQQQTIEFTAPATAAKLEIQIAVSLDGNGKQFFLDDFSLTSEVPKANIGVPSELQAKKTYQRELELTWGEVTGATYELQVGDKTFQSSTNSFLLTGLMPGTNYEVKVRALKDGGQSSWVVASVQTSALTTQVNDEMRTPYLRTIGSDGTCATALQLFYSELHGSDATFAYKINGQTATPKEHILTLPKGRSTLQVEVKEANDRIWLLIYTLDAK